PFGNISGHVGERSRGPKWRRQKGSSARSTPTRSTPPAAARGRRGVAIAASRRPPRITHRARRGGGRCSARLGRGWRRGRRDHFGLAPVLPGWPEEHPFHRNRRGGAPLEEVILIHRRCQEL